MTVGPMNPNTIEISTVPAGCCKTKFDTTYPSQLNGIISPAEFKESIDNINRATSTQKHLMMIAFLTAVCFVAAVALFIAGGITTYHSRSLEFPTLVAIGFGVFFAGLIVTIIGCIIIQVCFSSRLKQAVATESAKYSNRSPKPCSWRLHTSSYWSGRSKNRRKATVHHILIDIGTSGGMGNANPPQQQNQANRRPFSSATPLPPIASSPPSYSSVVGGGFCRQCGTAKQNPEGRFCSSCGQPYNN